MRVIRVSVKSLFGIFDHDIRLKSEERITIIHSPNGYGKTTILRLIHAALELDIPYLTEIPFNDLQITFEDGESLTVTQSNSSLNLSLDNGKEKMEALLPKRSSEDSSKWYSRYLDRLIDDRREPHAVLDLTFNPAEYTSESLQLFEYVLRGDLGTRGKELLPLLMQRSGAKSAEENVEALKRIQERTAQTPTYFIDADRLFITRTIEEEERIWRERRTIGKRPHLRRAVEEYSRELSLKIRQILAESTNLSQSLDSTFPTRLVTYEYKASYSDEEIRKRLELIRQKRKKLVEAGLHEEGTGVMDIPPKQLDETTKRVLALYVSDSENKLRIFNDFAQKVEALMEIINSLFLYKRLSISKDEGFVVRNNSQVIPLGKLSSGEQQQLVLFYSLLFRTKPRSLILIDEPELSLHVAWQEQFLLNLGKVVKLAGIDVLIATHSPEIVYDREDLMVELGDPKK